MCADLCHVLIFVFPYLEIFFNYIDIMRTVYLVSYHVDRHERMLQGVLDFVREQEVNWNIHLLMMSSLTEGSPLDPEPEDGLLVLGADYQDRRNISSYPCRKVMLYDYAVWPTTGVGLDHVAVGRMAAQHLQERGYRSFVYFEAGDDPTSKLRGDGFCQEHPDALRFVKGTRETLQKAWQLQNQLEDLADILRGLPGPVAVFCPNVVHGERILQAAKLADLQIPTELGVVVSDVRNSFCELLTPSLSQVSWSQETLGWMAAELLSDLMEGRCPEGTQRSLQPENILIRESSSYWSSELPSLQQLHTLLQEDWSINRDYDRIAERLQFSRRSLDRHCMQAYGITLRAHIERLRVDRTLEALRSTREPLAELALAMGYASQSHMSTSLKQATGKTPGQLQDRSV